LQTLSAGGSILQVSGEREAEPEAAAELRLAVGANGGRIEQELEDVQGFGLRGFGRREWRVKGPSLSVSRSGGRGSRGGGEAAADAGTGGGRSAGQLGKAPAQAGSEHGSWLALLLILVLVLIPGHLSTSMSRSASRKSEWVSAER
jgi:hypothetical protein